MVILLDALSVLVEFVRLRYPAHTNKQANISWGLVRASIPQRTIGQLFIFAWHKTVGPRNCYVGLLHYTVLGNCPPTPPLSQH